MRYSIIQYANCDFSGEEIEKILVLLQQAHQTFGGSDVDTLPIDADIPCPFFGEDFLRSIEANAEIVNTSDYVETMLMRVKTLLSDAKLKSVICSDTDITLTDWLDKYICPSEGKKALLL